MAGFFEPTVEEAEITEAISHRAHREQSLLSGGGIGPAGRHMDRETRGPTASLTTGGE